MRPGGQLVVVLGDFWTSTVSTTDICESWTSTKGLRIDRRGIVPREEGPWLSYG